MDACNRILVLQFPSSGALDPYHPVNPKPFPPRQGRLGALISNGHSTQALPSSTEGPGLAVNMPPHRIVCLCHFDNVS
jgi:hypothetical protein